MAIQRPTIQIPLQPPPDPSNPWWIPRVALGMGLEAQINLLHLSPLWAVGAPLIQVFGIAVFIPVIPPAKELSIRLAGDIRYGRKENAKRRRRLP